MLTGHRVVVDKGAKMKNVLLVATVFVLAGMHADCFAGCDCDDWVNKGGYCVDYVKSRIPEFPYPEGHAEIEALKNRETSGVAEGDAAIFDLGRYWHVAYVEKVHLDNQGKPVAIDVRETNFGKPLSWNDYASAWSPKSESEWKRALCCGVTDRYGQVSIRKNIPLTEVSQIWSPAVVPERTGIKRARAVAGKVRDAFSRFIQFAERVL